jgi:hypothetical protein
VIGLAAHVGGFLLRSSATTEPLLVVADLLYSLGFALWTGVVVTIFVQILPDTKKRHFKQALNAVRGRGRPSGPGQGWPGPGSGEGRGGVALNAFRTAVSPPYDAGVMELATPPLFAALRDARRVLIAGAGGGFDIYAGLPLAFALWDQGVEVSLANFSFTQLERLEPEDYLAPGVAVVTPATPDIDWYFPERALARWLAATTSRTPCTRFPRAGVQPLREAYQALVDHLQPDAIVLVDGGTDILMTGDESSLGTPTEDMTSVAAVAGLAVATRLVVCLGFGIDAYHGVAHTQVLENIAALDRDGAYLGALSIPSGSREAALYRDAVARRTGRHAGAAEHRARTDRGGGGGAVRRRPVHPAHPRQRAVREPADGRLLQLRPGRAGARVLYLDRIEHTLGGLQVTRRIAEFRETVTFRVPGRIPTRRLAQVAQSSLQEGPRVRVDVTGPRRVRLPAQPGVAGSP